MSAIPNTSARAGRCAREVLDTVGRAVAPGVTTDALDDIAHAATVARGAYPSPLNYHGFPKSICTSVNEVICHGIPDDIPLKEGDVINVDITVCGAARTDAPGARRKDVRR